MTVDHKINLTRSAPSNKAVHFISVVYHRSFFYHRLLFIPLYVKNKPLGKQQSTVSFRFYTDTKTPVILMIPQYKNDMKNIKNADFPFFGKPTFCIICRKDIRHISTHKQPCYIIVHYDHEQYEKKAYTDKLYRTLDFAVGRFPPDRFVYEE